MSSAVFLHHSDVDTSYVPRKVAAFEARVYSINSINFEFLFTRKRSQIFPFALLFTQLEKKYCP